MSKENDVNVQVDLPEEELIVDIVDDTPEADRDRTPIPEDELEEALNSHDADKDKRYRKMTKGFHDQRRIAEQATRERDEALRFAQAQLEKNKRLAQQTNQSTEIVVNQAIEHSKYELGVATQAFKEAVEKGDTEMIVRANEAILDAKMRLDKAQNFRHTPLQSDEIPVQVPQQAATPQPSQNDIAWMNENGWWFTSNPSMQAYARDVEKKLAAKGYIPGSEAAYEKITEKVKEQFPAVFVGANKDPSSQASASRPASVVAPASRTTAPRKIQITASAAAIAKRLGISIESYALEQAKLERRNG